MKICVMRCLRLQCSFAVDVLHLIVSLVLLHLFLDWQKLTHCWFFFLFLFKELRSCSSLTTDLRLLSKSSWWDYLSYHFLIPFLLHVFAYFLESSKNLHCSRVWGQYVLSPPPPQQRCIKFMKSDSKDMYDVSISICCSFDLSKNPEKKFTISTKNSSIDNIVSWAANQNIRMISEGSCVSEDWSNDAENSALPFQE